MKFKTLQEYLDEDRSEYSYTIKIALKGDLDDDMIANIEYALRPFEILNMSEVQTSPIHNNPLDFPNLKNVRVRIFDVTFQYPTTIEVLQRLISETLKIANNQIVVYNQYDPRREYTDQYLNDEHRVRTGTEYQSDETLMPEEAERQYHGERFLSELAASIAEGSRQRKQSGTISVAESDLIPSDQESDDEQSDEMDLNIIGSESPLSRTSMTSDYVESGSETNKKGEYSPLKK